MSCAASQTECVLPSKSPDFHDLPPEFVKDGFSICNPALRSFFNQLFEDFLGSSSRFQDDGMILQRCCALGCVSLIIKYIFHKNERSSSARCEQTRSRCKNPPAQMSPPFGTINFLFTIKDLGSRSPSFCLPTQNHLPMMQRCKSRATSVP